MSIERNVLSMLAVDAASNSMDQAVLLRAVQKSMLEDIDEMAVRSLESRKRMYRTSRCIE